MRARRFSAASRRSARLNNAEWRKGRRESKRQTGGDRDREREGKHAEVERGILQACYIRRTEPHQNSGSACGEQQSSRCAGQREHQAFGDRLSDDSRAAGAERYANHHLAAARDGARQQQVGQIGACDQQDKAYRAHQDREP